MAIEGNLTTHDFTDESAKGLVKDIIKEKETIIKNGGFRKDNCLLDIGLIEEPFSKPQNWEWIRFGDLGFMKKGPFGSDLTKGMFVEKSENSIKVYEQQNAIKKDWKLGTYYIKKYYTMTKCMSIRSNQEIYWLAVQEQLGKLIWYQPMQKQELLIKLL